MWSKETERQMGQRLDNAKSLYVEAIRDGNYETAINTYAGQRYIQHSTPVKDGKAGFIEFFADFVNRNPIRDIEILRGFEDGPYVFLHVLQTLNNGESRYVTADIFDTDEDAKLIEHWDIIEELADSSTSAHSQIDGPTEPTDLDKTAPNKTLVADFINHVLTDGRNDRIGRYISAGTFTERGTGPGSGGDSVGGHLATASQSARYKTVHNIIGSGSFVAALSEATHGPTPTAVIDLFRVAGGRIVEHWDVSEPIAPSETWVNSGKF
jgi:predicted SnoaL-like aldol condensation-catalyzing enzyme